MSYLMDDEDLLYRLNEMMMTDKSYNNNLSINLKNLPVGSLKSKKISELYLKYIAIIEERKNILSELEGNIDAQLRAQCRHEWVTDEVDIGMTTDKITYCRKCYINKKN